MPNSSQDILRAALDLHGQGQHAKAKHMYLRYLSRFPGTAEAWRLLSLCELALGEPAPALEHSLRACDLAPDNAELHALAGIALHGLGRAAEAAQSLKRASELAPDDPEILNALGAAACEAGDFKLSVKAHREALKLVPDSPEALSGLGNALCGLSRHEEALSFSRKAVQLRSEDPNFHNNLGSLLNGLGRTLEAAKEFALAAKLDPGFSQARDNLGNALRELGDDAGAWAAYQEAAALEGGQASAVKLAIYCPILSDSLQDIDETRQRIGQSLMRLIENPPKLCDPYREIGQTNFYLAYHGRDDLELQRLSAQFYLAACPQLAHVNAASRGPGRIRIGMVSAFWQTHTIGKLNYGLVKDLDRERFSLTLFKGPGRSDALWSELESFAERSVSLPDDYFAARRLIEENPQDILYYPDIGMHALSYFLAFSRLARLQCLSWGHPVSSGLPELDVFLSSELMEPLGSAAQYSERLIKFNNFNAFAKPLEKPENLPGRERLGLPEAMRLYVCPQSPYKLHPDFDPMLADILRHDPRALIVLLRGTHELIAKRLLARLSRSHPEAGERIIFLPPLAHADYLCLLACADVILDTPHFGGGYSSFEALSLGAPVVSLAGEFMRSRLTLALYAKLGFEELLAKDAQDYVEIALKLAGDADYRAYAVSRILSSRQALGDYGPAVRETGDFLESELAKLG